MNNVMKRLVIAALASLPFAGPALAASIEITIPVEIRDMHPDVNAVFVSCYLFDESGSYLPTTAGSGPNWIVDGAFSGDVVASADGDPSLADAADSYLCYLMFSIHGVGGTHLPGPVPTIRWDPTEYVRDRLRVAEGTQLVHYFQGSF